MNSHIIDFQKAAEIVSNSVFGIGYHDGPNFIIFGTGFVINDDGWILTNRHVLEPLLKERNDGKLEIIPKSRVLQFVIQQCGNSGCRIGYSNTRITDHFLIEQTPLSTPINQRNEVDFNGQKADLVLAPEAPDIAICKIDLSLLAKESLPLTPARMKSSSALKVGTPIAILGFSQGLQGPVTLSIENIQCSPILQLGCISAVLPHPRVPNPTEHLLDIYINGGSSGSPLFDSEGNVFGVVFASRTEFAPMFERKTDGTEREFENYGVHTNSSIGCAVPNDFYYDRINDKFPGILNYLDTKK